MIPSESATLAEFIGIMLGDGGIGTVWQATISLNAVSDKSYSHYVADLCFKLFSILPAIRKRKNQNTLLLVLSSVVIVDFLMSHGFALGNKLKNGLRIPEWILKNPDYARACIRGLVDTDGCLYIHRHMVRGKHYESVGLCFTSYSPELLCQVASVFEQFGIFPHITDKGRRIYLYRKEAVARYIEIFGTSNERIERIYRKGGVA